MNRTVWLTLAIWLSISLLATCAGSPKNTPTPVPTPTPLPTSTSTPTPLPSPTPTPLPIPTLDPSSQSYFNYVNVGNYKLFLDCKGQGEPTIILENGLGYASWTIGLDNYKTFSRTCFYSRAGMNGEILTGWRTTEDQVQDLHALIQNAGIPGPFILVGHSIAGYNLALYTYHYPEQVVGLVCVDCRPPMFDKNMLDALGEEQPDESQDIKDQCKFLTQGVENVEYLDIVASAVQAQKVTSLGDVPLVVLVAEKSVTPDPPASSIDILFDKVWLESSEEFSKLSSRGRMEIVPGVDHGTIPDSDAVTKAIQEVVEAARQTP